MFEFGCLTNEDLVNCQTSICGPQGPIDDDCDPDCLPSYNSTY